jgi:hypothetical protein
MTEDTSIVSIDARSFNQQLYGDDSLQQKSSPSKQESSVGPSSPKIMHNSMLKSFKNLSPIKKGATEYPAAPASNRVKIEKNPSKSRERLEINQSSGSIVEVKKLKIFEKVFELLLMDSEKTIVPLIHPSTANLRKVPFQVMELLIDAFMEFEEKN